MEDDKCAQICLRNMVLLCPVSTVVRFGNLNKGTCANAGFTDDTGTTHTANAGPCGKITFNIYAMATTPAPTDTTTTTGIPAARVDHDGRKCTDEKNDCCASPTWGEPQTCKDGYVAKPIMPKECPNKGCAIYEAGIGCYGCYPPTFGGTWVCRAAAHLQGRTTYTLTHTKHKHTYSHSKCTRTL